MATDVNTGWPVPSRAPSSGVGDSAVAVIYPTWGVLGGGWGQTKLGDDIRHLASSGAMATDRPSPALRGCRFNPACSVCSRPEASRGRRGQGGLGAGSPGSHRSCGDGAAGRRLIQWTGHEDPLALDPTDLSGSGVGDGGPSAIVTTSVLGWRGGPGLGQPRGLIPWRWGGCRPSW